MVVIKVSGEFFSVKDTLLCGQIFRFEEFNNGYKVYAGDKCCFAYNQGNFAFVECEKDDEEFFCNYFDIYNDYSKIYNNAVNCGFEIVEKAARLSKGVRILNQNPLEMLFSFIVSQNNNIPRIKKSIAMLCEKLGEEKIFNGEKYYAFPSLESMANAPLEFYRSIGLGYRAEYLLKLSKDIYLNGFDVQKTSKLSTQELKRELIKIHGVGEKVADCVLLFGFKRTDSFPVDTWIDKVYRENFYGTEKDRHKISRYFLSLFKENSGYVQQYLFYYKRSLEKRK